MKRMWFFEKRVWLSGFAGLFVAYMCCLQGCAEKTTKQESPCRASRVVSPSGEEGAAEPLPASPASNESFPVNPPSMLPPHNAWGGSNAGLDMEAFGPSGTVVFRNHAFPLGDTPKEEAKAPPAGR